MSLQRRNNHQRELPVTFRPHSGRVTKKESALNTLAETTTTKLTQKQNPSKFEQNKRSKVGGHAVKLPGRNWINS